MPKARPSTTLTACPWGRQGLEKAQESMVAEQARGPVLLRVARDVAKAKYGYVLMRPTDVVANGHAVWRSKGNLLQMYYSVESSWYITDSKFTPEGKNCFAHFTPGPDDGALLPTGLRRWKREAGLESESGAGKIVLRLRDPPSESGVF